MTVLRLREAPQSNRKDDIVHPGEAVAIETGDEVPRGCDFVLPFTDLVGPPELLEPPPLEHPPAKWLARGEGPAPATSRSRVRDERERERQAIARQRDRVQAQAAENADTEAAPGEDEDLPAREPARDWDLAARYREGTLELPRVDYLGSPGHVPIGAWARNRDELVPERTLLRAGEVALLEALGIGEVEVYRKPVVGIASLSEPLPSPNKPAEGAGPRRKDGRRGGAAEDARRMAGVPEGKEAPQRGRRPAPVQAPVEEELEDIDMPSGICPLTQLCMHLCRQAQVAALPLGYAPTRFRPLSLRVERWLSQVDVLLLVGGGHHGPRCLAQDLIATYGKLAVAGADLAPGGYVSAGSLAGKAVFALPGSLPDVLSSFVLFVRPLLHKYLSPLHFEGELPLALEFGSRLRFEHNTAVGLRYGYSKERHGFFTRYSGPWRGQGREPDPWLEYIRGQALAVFEGGREYADGEVITVYPY
jgi:molybdopterin biosynthesis enzyme